jgi:hypothetical protein
MPTAADITSITATKAAADPPAMLRAQLNRFASPFAPPGFRLFQKPLPSTGPVDVEVARRAGIVMIKRLTAQKGQSFDSTLEALSAQVLLDQTGIVVSNNIQIITGIVAGYATAHGLPGANRGALRAIIEEPSLTFATLGGLLLGVGVAYFKRQA